MDQIIWSLLGDLGPGVGADIRGVPYHQDLRNNRWIGSIDLTELLQKLWIPVIEADDLCKLGAVAPFMFYYFTPNFDLTKKERRPANRIPIILRRSDDIPT